jgi:triacylglycerol lipase
MPHPIVLAHGIARFDALRRELEQLGFLTGITAGDGLHYFRNIKTCLESQGFAVYHSNVSFAAGVEQRARELAGQVEAICAQGHEKVHIIGHSMGGLDARHVIVDLPGMASKIASLTTIGTPHRGTSFADWGIRRGGDEIIRALEGILDLTGFADLTTDACETFNQRALELEATNPVVYQTYASHQEKVRVFGLLQPSWQIIRDREGANDGLVPVRSQAWAGELRAPNGKRKSIRQNPFPVSADHLNQVGWWDANEWFGLQGRSAYEAKIQNVYLQIAKSVSAIV